MLYSPGVYNIIQSGNTDLSAWEAMPQAMVAKCLRSTSSVKKYNLLMSYFIFIHENRIDLKGILRLKFNPRSNTPWHRVRPPPSRNQVFPTTQCSIPFFSLSTLNNNCYKLIGTYKLWLHFHGVINMHFHPWAAEQHLSSLLGVTVW